MMQDNPDTFETLLTKARAIANKIPNISDELLEQGIHIANQLKVLSGDSETLLAAMLYPVFSQSNLTDETAAKLIPAPLLKLLMGTKRLEIIDRLSKKDNMDNLRKMMLAIVADSRIVLIKLTERLIALKDLRQATSTQQQAVAKKVMDIYAPLANRLGIGQLKWQLEDWAFRYLDPDNYHRISKLLKMRRVDREKYIQHMVQQITQLLATTTIENPTVAGRPKHIYSIYRKIQRKDMNHINQLYDISAVRILVPTIEDCYTVLSLIHSTWQPVQKEFDDYIAKPKPNGYRSIHTAIIGPDHHPVEIQIRTCDMHRESELGIAAHWKYKEGKTVTPSYEEKIAWLRSMSSHMAGEADSFSKIFSDRIYTVTPKGDILDLEAGSTPLDMAYHVHTEIGHRCRGAKVNEIMVPLTHILQTGDRVEILTVKTGRPSRDWMNPTYGFLKTSSAREKVRRWFHQQDSHEQDSHEKEKMLIASKKRDAPKLLANRTMSPSTLLTKTGEKTRIESLNIAGVGNLLTQLAKCCRPIPGDPIVGYITQGRGISIHQQNCFNIKQALQSRLARMISVHWGTETAHTYPVDLMIEAADRAGLLRDISSIIANAHIPILGLSAHTDKLQNRAYVQLTIAIGNLDLLDHISQKLKQIPEIIAVKRA